MFFRIPAPVLADDPDRDPQEAAFLRAILEDPDDDTPRLVFADWLEENGRTVRATFVRREVEMSRLPQASGRYAELREELSRLDESIGGNWTWALVRVGRLLNCGSAKTKDPLIRFAFECPRRWADLTATEQEGVRFCGQCQKRVYHCASKEEAEAHALKKHCIAISSRLALRVRKEYAPPEPLMPPENASGTHFTLATDEEEEILGDLALSDGPITGLPMSLGRPPAPPSPYELWAVEFFARRRKPWWEFWK